MPKIYIFFTEMMKIFVLKFINFFDIIYNKVHKFSIFYKFIVNLKKFQYLLVLKHVELSMISFEDVYICK